MMKYDFMLAFSVQWCPCICDDPIMSSLQNSCSKQGLDQAYLLPVFFLGACDDWVCAWNSGAGSVNIEYELSQDTSVYCYPLCVWSNL